MHLLEFAAQGARGISPNPRLTFRPGYLVLKPQEGASPPLAGLLSSVLYADGRGGEASFAAPGQKGKVGLVLLGNDQVTYRLTRELGGPGGLYRFNKTKNAFEVVTEDSAEMVQFLRGQVGLPTKTAFEQLFTFTTAHLPSKKPKPRSSAPAAGASGSKPLLASNQPVAAANDLAAAKAKLQELRQEREHAEEVDKIQFRLDGLSTQVFETEQKLKSTEGVKAALKNAEAAYNEAPTPESLGLPVDIVSRVERYPFLQQKRDDALAKLEADRLQMEELPSGVEPLTKNQLFWAGIAGGVFFIAIAIIFGGAARYLALLDIPAFGFAALNALKYVEELQGAERKGRKGGMHAAREKKIHDEFEAEAKYVRDAMRTLHVESPNEIVDMLSKKALLLDKVQGYRDQLGELEADPDFLSASARVKQLKAEQEALNDELMQKGAYVRDIREVEREIARTEESIQLALSAPAAAPAPAPTAAPTPGEPFEDPTPALLKVASDLLGADVMSAGTLLKDRCLQYLTALADKRILGVELDKDGKGFALLAGGKKVPVGELPARDLDLFYLSLRMTVIEKVSARLKVPVVFEEAPGVEEAKLALFSRMLRHLGTLTQVIHATAHPAFPAVADVNLSL